MCDLAYALRPRSYPEAFGLVYNSFAVQPDEQTCGAAALRHGLLLGGLTAPVGLLERLLEIRNEEDPGADYVRLLEALRRLGFKVEQHTRQPTQTTAEFLNESIQLAQGGFLLPCFQDGGHWVCMGAWDGTRAWIVDSYYGEDGILFFGGWTAQEFEWSNHADEWEDCINVIRPGIWAKQYQNWLPARRALMRVPVDDPACMEAAVGIAAHQYLDDADYGYNELGVYLPGGVAVAVNVDDPGADAILVRAEGEGEDRVLVFRPVPGVLTGPAPPGQTPPLLVVRANRLRATWLH